MCVTEKLFAAGGAPLIQSSDVPSEPREIGTSLDALPQCRLKVTGYGNEFVITPHAVLSPGHKSDLSQVSQVPGCLGLRDAQYRHQVAYAQFVRQEQIENAEPSLVRHRPKETFWFECDRRHDIRLCEYMIRGELRQGTTF